MSKKAFHRGKKKVIKPKKFLAIEGPGWRQRVRDGTAVWAECLGCGRDMGPRISKGKLVSHFYHRTGEDASDCPYSPKPNPRFRHLWVNRWNIARGERLRREFCEERNLKSAFNVCNRIAGSVNTDEFIAMVREADRRSIWRYSAINLAFVPYVLLTLIDFHAAANSNRVRRLGFEPDFRFVIGLSWKKPLSRIWKKPGEYELQPVFTDTGNRIYKIPTRRITDSRIDERRDDIDWISEPAYQKLDRALCLPHR